MLYQRLRLLLEEERWPQAAPFDPDDDAQLDEAARRLLDRFRSRRDAEAFALLMELTRGRMLDIATRLAVRSGARLAPGALVKATYRQLFNAPPTAPDTGFFAAARRIMEVCPARPAPWSGGRNAVAGPSEAA